MFADDFRCSMPAEAWGDVQGELERIAGDAGFLADYANDRASQLRLDGATIKSEATRGLRVVSVSGQALARLRLLGMLGGFLAGVGQVPHRVTGLHATTDRREPTAPVIAGVVAKAESAGGLRAGRKRIPASSLLRFLQRLPDGSDTGTVYCGTKHAEIRPVVYDKRQERMARGLPDLGHDLTRYELRLRSGVGVTLRDVHDPAPVFWHYMAPDFLPRPEGVPAWVPEASGFSFDRPSPPLPAERLRRAVEGSDQLRELVGLAVAFPGGSDYFCRLVRGLVDAAENDRVSGSPPAARRPAPVDRNRRHF